jgi:hypothetical protein
MVDRYQPKLGMPGEDGADGAFNRALHQITARDPMRFAPFGHEASMAHGYLCGALMTGGEGWRRALEALEKLRTLTFPLEVIYPKGWVGSRPQTVFANADEYERVFVAPVLRDVNALHRLLDSERAGEITTDEANDQARKIISPHGGDRRSESFQGDNYPLESSANGRGTSASHLTARLLRDRPDIHARLMAREFRSVRAAAIEAGIITPRPRVCIPLDDPIAAAALLRRRLAPDDFAALIGALREQGCVHD